MSTFRNYDPERVTASWRGILLQGFASGTFISAERTEDAYTPVVGGTGDVTRVRSRNRMGSVTLTLMAASPVNDQLDAAAVIDEQSMLGYGPLLIKDLNGTTVIQATQAWIRKRPTVELGSEASDRVWVLDCADLEMTVGGAVA